MPELHGHGHACGSAVGMADQYWALEELAATCLYMYPMGSPAHRAAQGLERMIEIARDYEEERRERLREGIR